MENLQNQKEKIGCGLVGFQGSKQDRLWTDQKKNNQLGTPSVVDLLVNTTYLS